VTWDGILEEEAGRLVGVHVALSQRCVDLHVGTTSPRRTPPRYLWPQSVDFSSTGRSGETGASHKLTVDGGDDDNASRRRHHPPRKEISCARGGRRVEERDTAWRQRWGGQQEGEGSA
jgi:hypothetical protein